MTGTNMGKMVHVAKTYKVEYGNTEAFNWAHENFYNMLYLLGGEPNWVGDSDYPTDMFECSVEDYADAVANLKVYIKTPHVYDQKKRDELAEALKGLGVTAEQLLKTMEDYQQEADTSDGYLHFSAW